MSGKKKPQVRYDPVQTKAEQMVARLNGLGNGLGGTGKPAADLMSRIVRGGKVSGSTPDAKATNEFVAALTKPSKPKSRVGKDNGPLAQKLGGDKKKQGRNSGQPETDEFLERMSSKDSSIRPSKKKGKQHRGTTLAQDERSLLDGMSEDGFVGPQQEQV